MARLQLGAELRRLRVRAGIDGDIAAQRMRGSTAKLSRMESGQLPVKRADLDILLDLYEIHDADRDRLISHSELSRQPGWWDDFGGDLPSRIRTTLALEAEALAVWVYETQAIPALLQTPEYARAVSKGHDPDDMRWRGGLALKTLQHRRALMTSDDPPRLWALIHEAAVRRVPDGDIDLARKQINELRSAARRRNVHLQIVPEGISAALAAPGPFSILRFSPADVKDVVLVDSLRDIRTLHMPGEIDAYNFVWNLLATQAMDDDTSCKLLDRIDDWLQNIAARQAAKQTAGRVSKDITGPHDVPGDGAGLGPVTAPEGGSTGDQDTAETGNKATLV